MSQRIESWLGARLGRLVAWVVRHRRPALAALSATTVALGLYAGAHLGVNTDHKRLISEDLPFQRVWHEFASRFPTLDDAVLVVVEGNDPARTREAARSLADRLASMPELFHSVLAPGMDPFFETHGLLYRSTEELDRFVGELATVQPLLAELSRDRSLANLAHLVRQGLHEGAIGGSEAAWRDLLDGLRGATVSVYQEPPVSVPWEQLLLAGSSFETEPMRVLVVEPVLDFDRLLPAARALAALRTLAQEVAPEGSGVSVRLTGNPALNHEEMLGLARDLGVASLLSLLLVSGVLRLAFRSWRLVGAAAGTLLAGLVWTAAFAAAAIGELNVVSVAFAVLFVGLGVDFSIHLGAHYTEMRHEGRPHAEALAGAVRQVGGALALCSVTTALGFFSFLPTDFRGVAELGLIAGTGMFVILLLTFTLFPLLLGDAPGVGEAPSRDPVRRLAGWLLGLSQRHPRSVVGAAVLLAVAAAAVATRAGFDANVVELRDPATESVQAFEALLARRDASPWSLDVLAEDLDRAQALRDTLAALPGVLRATTVADYVPDDQAEKLALLEEASMVLYLPEPETQVGGKTSLEEQIDAVRQLHAALDVSGVDTSAGIVRSAGRVRYALAQFLMRVGAEPNPRQALDELEERVLGEFPRQLSKLRTALGAGAVTLQDLPPDLVRRMRAPDGTSRVQVVAAADLSETDALHAFVEDVRAVSPEITGVPVHLVEFAAATARSLREALGVAAVAITAMLVALWWRVRDPLRVLAVLSLGALGTTACMVLMGQPFNFANVIVIPLLLGVGVDSCIHVVERWRSGAGTSVEATTARAILYSALTTLASFGTLTLSDHRGIASLGAVLVVGMVFTTLASLVVLPALLRIRKG